MIERLVTFKRVLSCTVLLGTLAPSVGLAQWATQKISLQPGWNALYLEVEPEPRTCEAVFAGRPIESVWAWNRRFSPVQFIQDPATLVPEQPEWLTYTPGPGATADLHVLQGGHAYLVQVRGNAPVEWTIVGKPVVRPIDWMGDSFNLVGFRVDSGRPPTFSAFLAASAAHIGQPVYRLGANREWEPIVDLSTETIRAGEAYWIFCQGPSDYSGPLKLTLEQAGMLDFGRILTEQTLRIANQTSVPRQVFLRKRASQTPPVSQPLPAGEVLLSYWDSIALVWVDFPEQLQVRIEPGEELGIRIAVRRKDMTGGPGAIYQSLLEVSDGQGYLVRVPVTARGMTSYAGLWVGAASIDKVSFPAGFGDSTIPKTTAGEFPLRLLIHVDAQGQARLLQQATLMWKEGTLKPDPAEPTKKIVEEPGRYVILTRDDLASQFSGAAVRDGKPFGRRISSSAFASSDHPESSKFPLLMTGTFNSTLQRAGITLHYDDPLNPFKHKYHPDHDNLDYDFETAHPEGKESYTIVRGITLVFAPDDPDGLPMAGWGDTQVGGIYRESIEGIHKKVLYVEGSFRLHQVSRVAVLNDGL